MKSSGLLRAAAAAAILLGACRINEVECGRECQDYWMDGAAANDSSCLGLDTAHPYRVSRRAAPATDADKAKPVIIAVHGFSASTFEWLELRRFAGDVPGDSADTASARFLVSLVLLGGHGRDIRDFRDSSWEAWGRPILEEYDSLVAKGYTNISFAGSSTGCALLLHYIGSGEIRKRKVHPRWIFLVDPIVTPTAKLLSLVNILGPVLGNSPNDDLDAGEKPHWYTNRPSETLAELYELINLVKNRLEDGFRLPPGTGAKLWKAKSDGEADPVSALQIYKGLRTHGGGRIHVEMVDSRKHVFTRLLGRGYGPPLQRDLDIQRAVFEEMEHPENIR